MSAASRWCLADGRALSVLDDATLEAERAERRRRRTGERMPAPDAQQRKIAQWLANLELGPRAGQREVESAYERLRERYAPVAERAEGERRKAAETLLRSLREAYDGLLRHLS